MILGAAVMDNLPRSQQLCRVKSSNVVLKLLNNHKLEIALKSGGSILYVPNATEF